MPVVVNGQDTSKDRLGLIVLLVLTICMANPILTERPESSSLVFGFGDNR